MAGIEAAVDALEGGLPVILPTDTVYGLCASPFSVEPARRMYGLKGRAEEQPTAIVAASLERLLECVPELRGRSGDVARALLPGPFTLIFPNPARRFRWLTGDRPDTIGVRVPELPGPAAAVVGAVGAVAATSANLPGGSTPRRIDDIPEELRAGVAAIVDCGELPGLASTILDCTGPEPVVLREGAVPAPEALERVRTAVA